MKKCAKCGETKSRESFYKDKRYKDKIKATCKECKKIAMREYYKKQIKEDPEYAKKKYNKKNKERQRITQRAYQKKRCSEDHLFRLKHNTRNTIRQSFKNKSFKKNTNTHKIIGCSYEEFAEYLQSQFQEGMTMENYGEWHIDHRLPLAAAKTKEEIIALNHYTNLQPLWAADNLAKLDKHCPDELKEYLDSRRST